MGDREVASDPQAQQAGWRAKFDQGLRTGKVAMNQVGVFHTGTADDSVPLLGTLLWIGDAAGTEFNPAYQHCLAHAPQVAVRGSMAEAFQRPAAAVRGIVIAQSERSLVSAELLAQLRQRYPQAEILCLMGSCCEGMYAKVLDPAFARTERLYSHQWRQVLPLWLQNCGSLEAPATGRCRSVVVVSATPAFGDALMDLAESTGATTIWCRDASCWQVRRVDAVWWDDSVAFATTAAQWRQRTHHFSTSHGKPSHVWIANAPRHSQQLAAAAGGVSIVVSKPFRIESLLGMLDLTEVDADTSDASLRAA